MQTFHIVFSKYRTPRKVKLETIVTKKNENINRFLSTKKKERYFKTFPPEDRGISGMHNAIKQKYLFAKIWYFTRENNFLSKVFCSLYSRSTNKSHYVKEHLILRSRQAIQQVNRALLILNIARIFHTWQT